MKKEKTFKSIRNYLKEHVNEINFKLETSLNWKDWRDYLCNLINQGVKEKQITDIEEVDKIIEILGNCTNQAKCFSVYTTLITCVKVGKWDR